MAENKKKKWLLERLPPRLFYSMLVFPGLGQWEDGAKLRGVLIMASVLVIFAFGFLKYAGFAAANQNCPFDMAKIEDLVPCTQWIHDQAWALSQTTIRRCGLALLGVYLFGVGEAVFVRRADFGKKS